MRWPIATGSRMQSAAFQIHDELVRTSLYKEALHEFPSPARGGIREFIPPPLAGEGRVGGVIQLKGRAVEHGGTVRGALTSRTDSTRSAPHDVPRPGANLRIIGLLVGSVALGLGLAIIWSPSFVDQTIGENGATTILGYSVTATPITGILMAIGFAFVSGLTGTFTACNVAGRPPRAPPPA